MSYFEDIKVGNQAHCFHNGTTSFSASSLMMSNEEETERWKYLKLAEEMRK